MKYIRRFLALICVALFIILLPAAVWVLNGGAMLLQADTFLSALNRHHVYDNLLPLILPAIAEIPSHIADATAQDPELLNDPEFQEAFALMQDSETLSLANIVRNLGDREWRQITEELVPPEWLREQIETNIQAFFDWLNSNDSVPALAFDIASLRERLSGAPGQRAVNLIISSWPSCTTEQTAQLAELLNVGADAGVEFPLCNPPGEYVAFTSLVLSSLLREEVSYLPDSYPDPNWLHSPEAEREFQQFRQAVRIHQALVIDFALIPAALFSLVVFFTVRSLKSLGRWLGWSMIISGIFSIIPVPLLLTPFFISPVFFSVATENPGAPPDGGVSVAFNASVGDAPTGFLPMLVENFTRTIIGELVVPILIVGGLMILIGFAALVIAAITRSPEEVLEDDLQSLAITSSISIQTPTPTKMDTLTGSIAPNTDLTPSTHPMLFETSSPDASRSTSDERRVSDYPASPEE